jgi:hypothetical protein
MCDSTVEYCERDVSDVGGIPDTFFCKPLPDACKSGPMAHQCICLEPLPCGGTCVDKAAGAFELMCAGG